MNVGGVPFNQHPMGFWMVVTLIALITLAIVWFAVRRLAPRK